MSDDLVKRARAQMAKGEEHIKSIGGEVIHKGFMPMLCDRIEELEAKLAKALLIIEAYGDDEGYIPKRVVHLWNELTGGKDE